MIKIVADNYVKAEELEKALPLLRQLAEKSRGEDGCLEYALFADKRDAAHIVIIETWQSKEALKAHGETPHFTSILAQLKPLMAKPMGMTMMEPI